MTHPPRFKQAVELLRRCERAEVDARGQPVGSWLEYCDALGIYHCLTAEYADAIAEEIERLAPRAAVEVAAGAGHISAALQARGIDITPTDPQPGADEVMPLDAAAALARLEPDLVLGAWTQVDSAVDEAVLTCPSTRWYVYVGHEHNGLVGHDALWNMNGWRHRRLEAADKFNLGRTDFCADLQGQRIVQHGHTILFERTDCPGARR